MSKEAAQTASADPVVWFDGKAINEVIFCEEFLRDYPMITVNGTFFTVNGIVNDENRLKKEIYDRILPEIQRHQFLIHSLPPVLFSFFSHYIIQM